MAQAVDYKKYKLRKDDNVEVITGKDKGKHGRILKILRNKNRAVIEGVNTVKKAQKRRSQNDRGGIIEIEAPIDISNIMIVCRKCGPVRVAYKLEGTTKTRVCKKCGEAL
jgi:large subunit ribosomal protein L24